MWGLGGDTWQESAERTLQIQTMINNVTQYSVILLGFHWVALSVTPTFRCAPCGAEIIRPFGTSV
ncbi:hypothetical protein Barb7_00900 [Bacteroidales bacterium Barb7]|nr:hypothetical protein Barb7_00900 [Bacteroidales bacterium Barb7]